MVSSLLCHAHSAWDGQSGELHLSSIVIHERKLYNIYINTWGYQKLGGWVLSI